MRSCSISAENQNRNVIPAKAGTHSQRLLPPPMDPGNESRDDSFRAGLAPRDMRGTAGCASITCAVTAARAADQPERIVSAGGSTTEVVYALGAGDKLVGVDTASLYPAAVTELPNIGYVRQLSAEGLLSLKPDLILAGPEAGPVTALRQAEGAGANLLQLSAGYTSDTVATHIETLGRALHREEKAHEIASAFTSDMEQVEAEIAEVKTRPRVLFLLQAGRGSMLVSGKGTAANAMIELSGGRNATADFDGYKPFSPEAAALAEPDILLMTSDTVEALGGPDAVFAQTALAMTPAAREKRLVTMDALYLAGFGPRLAHAMHDLASKFHPEHDFAPLPARPWTQAE